MIRIPHSSFPVAALTHPGMSGKNNEDSFAVSAYRLTKYSRVPVLLAVIADGIGGHRAGEVASLIAVEQISQVVAASDGSHPVETLHQAAIQASQAIYTHASADPGRHGMGSTCVCAWIIKDQLYTVTVGDSRLYLMRGGTITQLSTDHTWVQEAIDQGILRREDVRGHPNQHVIRRYLGSAIEPNPDLSLHLPGSDLPPSDANQGMHLLEGDRLFMCSDGLTDLVDDAEILAVFQQQPLEEACRALVELANQRGGHDNITVVVVEVPHRTAFERLLGSRRAFSLALLAALLLALAIFIGLVVGLGWLNRRGGNETQTPTPALTQATQGVPVVLPTVTLTPQFSPTSSAQPSGLPSFTPLPSATPPQQSGAPLPSQVGSTATAWPTNTSAPVGVPPDAPTATRDIATYFPTPAASSTPLLIATMTPITIPTFKP